MNINLKFLLCGAAIWLFPQSIAAQCAETDCLKLGYTSLQKCDGGLKCPFGEYWACPQKQCDDSYQYTCTGSNEQPGTDKCGDKYKSCNCASGYEWKDGKCQTKGTVLGQCTGYAKNCKIGDILNSDGTCTTNKESGKTPLGVVVVINGNCGWAMTAHAIKKNIKWSTKKVNTGTFQSDEFMTAFKDFNVSRNMTKIIQSGNSNTYPAAWAAVNYAPTTAPETKGKWTLPTAGILSRMSNYLSSIDRAISKLGGTQLMQDNEHIWSSSESSYKDAWHFCVSMSGSAYGGIDYSSKDQYRDLVVRPVIEF